jgi:hypothetical protein
MDKTGSGQAYDIGCIGFLGFKEAVIVTFLRVVLEDQYWMEFF